MTAGGGLTYTENDPATVIDATVTVTDPDSSITGATVQITVGCAAGEDVLSFVNIPPITGSGGGCSLTLSGTDTPANYQAALRTVKYNNTSENPSPTPRTVVWQVTDGTAPSNQPTSTINVIPVNDAPIGVIDRAHNVTGNVRIQVPVGTESLLNGVTDPEGNTLTAVVDGSSTHSGTITINPDGSYIYNPLAGRTGADVVKYKVCDNLGACSAVKNLTFNIANMLWFIDNNAGAGTGRLTDPFNSIAAFTAVNNPGADHPATGHTIFIHRNSATDYTGPLTLQNNQKVLGKGGSIALDTFAVITLAPHSDSLPQTGGTAPIITTSVAATNGVNLASGNSLRGFTVGNTTGAKISGSGFGTLRIGDTTTPDMTLNGTGQAFNLTNGTFDAASRLISVTTTSSTAEGIRLATVGGTVHLGATTVSGSTTQGILVTGSTGNVTFGNTSVTGGTDGVKLENNSAGTRTFGTLGITNSGSTGFLHTDNGGVEGGGLTSVTGLTTITNPGGLGISIQKSVAAKGVTFADVNVTGSGGIGVSLLTNAGAVTFADLDISPDAGVAAFSASGGTGTVTTTSGTINTSGQAISIAGPAGRTPLALVFDGVTSSGGASTQVAISNASGSVDINGGALSGGTGRALDVSGSTATIDFNASINNSGQGVSLTSNTGGIINLTGGVILNTGANAAFTATGGGTVSVTGANNTLQTTTNTALNVANTTIGASGLTFKSISAGTAASGPTNGIVLNNTGSTAGLTVSGDGTANSNGSGGVIQKTTGDGILLTTTRNVNLNQMDVKNGLNSGITGTGVTNFTLNRARVTTNGDSSSDDGLRLGHPSNLVVGVSGTVSITNSDISGNAHNNVHIRNAATSTIDTFTVSGSSFNNINDTTGANAFLLEISDNSVLTQGTISGNTFSTNSPQRALEVQAHTTGRIGDTAAVPAKYLVVSGNTFTDNGIHASFTQDGSSNLAFKFQDNGTVASPMVTTTLQAVNVFSSSQATGGTIVATISGNHIGNPAVAGSGSNGGSGIRVLVQGKTAATLLIDNNVIRQVGFTSGSRGMDLQFLGPVTAGQPITQSDITITNNQVQTDAPASTFPLAAIFLAADNQGSPARVRANITGNTVPATANTFDYPTFDGTAAQLVYKEVTAGAEGQLVDNAPGSATAQAELTSHNTGAMFGDPLVSLIAGPISTPP
jgi:hypothetical protein